MKSLCNEIGELHLPTSWMLNGLTLIIGKSERGADG
jgi:hypothetical protein